MDIIKLKQVIEKVKEELKYISFICTILQHRCKFVDRTTAELLWDAVQRVITKNQSEGSISLLIDERILINSQVSRNKFGEATRIYFLNCILEIAESSATNDLEQIVEVAYHKTKNNLENIYKNL